MCTLNQRKKIPTGNWLFTVCLSFKPPNSISRCFLQVNESGNLVVENVVYVLSFRVIVEFVLLQVS